MANSNTTDNIQKPRKTWQDYFFCLLVGGVYLYSINLAIISATFIVVSPFTLYLIGLISIVILMVILYNKYTRIASAVIALIMLAVVLFTLEDFSYQYPHFYELWMMVTGRIGYRPHLGQTVVWCLSLLLAFNVVVFMLHQFTFYLLALGGAATFALTWAGGFTRNDAAFLFFLIAFCLILIRKTNKNLSMVLASVPLIIWVVWLAHARVPQESEMFLARGEGNAPIAAVGDFFNDLFTPSHFSFQQTGFSGSGGRLGGPITPNNRHVMHVHAPGRVYLTGAISNHYTGERWISTLEHGDINHHGLPPMVFESLETLAALIRDAHFTHERSNISPQQLPIDTIEARRLQSQHLSVMGAMFHEYVDFFTTESLQGVFRWQGDWRDDSFFIFDNEHIHWIRDTIETEEWIHSRELQHTRRYFHIYIPFDTLHIQQSRMRTGTIFTPPRMMQLWFDEDSVDYSDNVQILPLGNMELPRTMSRETSYGMRFLNVDTTLSFVEEILRTAGAGVHEYHASNVPIRDAVGRPTDMNTIVAQRLGALEWLLQRLSLWQNSRIVAYMGGFDEVLETIDAFSLVLAMYAQQVREHFMHVPEIVPQRVHDLTAQITAGATSDFERVIAIRDFLMQFPYTMDTRPVPRGVCFVDWFLFEEQQGYCTYFASAMAVMSRIAGVPSRYVEGFAVPASRNAGEAVTVSNRMAHAWVEVYLEGFGWHLMEATPPYLAIMRPSFVPPPDFEPGTRDPGTLGGIWDDWMFEIDDDFNFPTTGSTPPSGGQTPPPINVIEPPAEPPAPSNTAHILLIVLIVACAFLAYLAMRIICDKIRQQRVNRLSHNEQLQAYFRAIMSIATLHTRPLTPEETEKAYGAYMGKRFAFRSDSVFLRDLIELYYKARYAPQAVSAADVALMKEAHADMLELLRETRRLSVYRYLRFVRRVGEVQA